MTWKLVYKLYIACLISCVSFIKISQVIFKYSQLKGFKLIKFTEKLWTVYKSVTDASYPIEKAQVITANSYNVLTTNNNLMNINYCCIMLFCYKGKIQWYNQLIAILMWSLNSPLYFLYLLSSYQKMTHTHSKDN